MSNRVAGGCRRPASRILRPWLRGPNLIDLIARDVARDPGDAPEVDVAGAVAAQELGWELDWADGELAWRT